VWLLDLLFWDSGFTSSTQYKYISSTPESHAHIVLYVVSGLDKQSWNMAQKRIEDDAHKPFAKLLVLTKSVSTHTLSLLVHTCAFARASQSRPRRVC
jgi:hypothetical protein